MKLDTYIHTHMHIYKHVLNFKQRVMIKWDLYFGPLFPLELPIFDLQSSNQLLIFCTQLGGNFFLDPCSTVLHSAQWFPSQSRRFDYLYLSICNYNHYYWLQNYLVFIIAFDSVTTPQNPWLPLTSSIFNENYFCLFMLLYLLFVSWACSLWMLMKVGRSQQRIWEGPQELSVSYILHKKLVEAFYQSTNKPQSLAKIHMQIQHIELTNIREFCCSHC